MRMLTDVLDEAYRELQRVGDELERTKARLAKAEAELRAKEEAHREGWQPIATAPKDGQEILVMCQNRAGLPGIVVAHYAAWVEDHPPIVATFYFWDGAMFSPATKPTHWMPLPAAPQDDAKDHG